MRSTASHCLSPIRHDPFRVARHQAVSGARLAARAGQCRPRLRHDRRRCAVLDRHRLAGRWRRDNFRDGHRAGARAARRAGLRRRPTLHRRHHPGPWSLTAIVAFAVLPALGIETVCRLQPRSCGLPGAHRRLAGASAASLAGRAVHRDDDAVHSAAATDQSDDLTIPRHFTTSARRSSSVPALRRCHFACCRRCRRPSAPPAARADLARSAPSRDRSQPT